MPLKRQYLSASPHVVISRERVIVEYVVESRVSKKSKIFTTQMQSIFWCAVVTICTTWFNIPILCIFPHTVYLYVAWDSQTKNGFLLEDSKEMVCLLWGTIWVFIYYVQEIRVSKTINWKTLRMVTQIKIGWGTKPEDLTLHAFMSLEVSVC